MKNRKLGRSSLKQSGFFMQHTKSLYAISNMALQKGCRYRLPWSLNQSDLDHSQSIVPELYEIASTEAR